MKLPLVGREWTGRKYSPPVIVTALLWIGVQILVLLYLQVAFSVDAEFPLRFARLQEFWAQGSDGGVSLRWGLLAINLLFVALLWLKFRSYTWSARKERLVGLLVYGGTSALLLLLQRAWEMFFRVERSMVIQQVYP